MNAPKTNHNRSQLAAIPKVDVHAHYLPPDYRQALLDNGHARPDGFPVLPTWSAQEHLGVMDRLGIGTSMLSLTTPGINFGEDPVVWARRVNEYGARMVDEHPTRFGLFASLPLADVDAAMVELAHAFDSLNADGVVIETHVNGIYLGDDLYRPVFAELDRRNAVMLLHPTSPACFEATALGYPRPLLEFLLDTTRAVSNMVLNGTLADYPGVEVIVPHSGAALPSVADRLAGMASVIPMGGRRPGEIDVIETLRRLRYEVGAGYPFPRQLAALLTLVDADRLLYGTDFPYGLVPALEANNDALLTTTLMDEEALEGVLRSHAIGLFPRLRPTASVDAPMPASAPPPSTA